MVARAYPKTCADPRECDEIGGECSLHDCPFGPHRDDRISHRICGTCCPDVEVVVTPGLAEAIDARLLALAALAIAGPAMPDTFWLTDSRIALACRVLGWSPEQAREWGQAHVGVSMEDITLECIS